MIEWIMITGLVTLIGVLVFFVFFQSKLISPSTLLIQQQIDYVRTEMSEKFSQTLTHVNEHLTQQSLQLNQQMGNLVQEMHAQLGKMGEQIHSAAGQMGARLDHAACVVGEVQQNLGALSKATENVYEVGKDIASLQEILKTPKLRGSFGEFFLGELLGQILPSSCFTLQHVFKSGDIVDALIHLGQGGVPVDSKFPLENFKRMIGSMNEEERKGYRKKFVQDVKKHIDQISLKYILPDEGTFDFALMYIPAENVYYETIIKEELKGEETSISLYSLERKVIPVSPNCFYAYLQAIVLGLKGLRIENSAKEILDYLSRLKGDFVRFNEEFEILGKHLNNSRLKYEDAVRKLDRFYNKLEEIEDPLHSVKPSVKNIDV
ncbi:MAG: DNA recombination protein RmuC [Nitrospirae bacterium]|nr:DNA recombination protein RmuC [Nitrospirota bacterium]MBI3352280.1 DNA recombination protein RmuC [Nitrospirota bacterium]